MGQKVNPLIFRLGQGPSEVSQWYSKTTTYSNLLWQDQEIKKFLSNLLRSRGIILRSSKILRTSQKLFVVLDLYFSYMLAKQSKFYWARALFKTIKGKYDKINRIRDLKAIASSLDFSSNEKYPDVQKAKQKKKFLREGKKREKFFLSSRKKPLLLKSYTLGYKTRFYFFLFVKKNKNLLVKKKDPAANLSVIKNYRRGFLNKPTLISLNFSKFKRLFALKKFRYSFRNFNLKKCFSFHCKKEHRSTLLDLNKKICQSLYNYTGIEEVELRIMSNQLNFLPAFKVYKKLLLKELFLFQRNKELGKYFFEIQETLFFVFGTFGFGNARLLGKLLIFLFEKSRKQLFTVKLLKKSLETFFQKFPPNFLAIHGVRILIKGRFNKRRRTKKIVLQQGQVSLQTIKVPIDYYQSQAVTIYGTFGIKVWLSQH